LKRGSLSGSVILVSGISPAKRRVMKIDLIRRGLGRPSPEAEDRPSESRLPPCLRGRADGGWAAKEGG